MYRSLRFVCAALVGFGVPLSAQSNDVLIRTPAAHSTPEAWRQFTPVRPVVDSAFECRGPGLSRANLVTFVGAFPTNASYRSQVVVSLDTSGRLVSSAERRGSPLTQPNYRSMSPQEQAHALQAAIAADSATTISINYITRRVVMSNHGPGIDATPVAGTLEDLAADDKSAGAVERARRVLETCRGGK